MEKASSYFGARFDMSDGEIDRLRAIFSPLCPAQRNPGEGKSRQNAPGDGTRPDDLSKKFDFGNPGQPRHGFAEARKNSRKQLACLAQSAIIRQLIG
jgi:hypothetical protein